jgi:hypothetical protein
MTPEQLRTAQDQAVAVADRQCTCGREILNNANACDRCTPVLNGHQHPNGNTETA